MRKAPEAANAICRMLDVHKTNCDNSTINKSKK